MSGMRATVKAVALGGYRSIGLFTGRLAAAAGMRASHPAIATVSVEGGPSMPICSLDKGSQDPTLLLAVQKPWWEEVEEVVALESLDPPPRLVFGPVPTLEEAKEATSDKGSQDPSLLLAVQKPWWEEEEEVVALGSLDPPPRLVFGPVPTLEEAKEATSDLADILMEMYPSTILSDSSTEVPHALFQLEAPAVVPSRHVGPRLVALLQGSPEVKRAVASIAADKNVWNAVMSSPGVAELQKIVFPPESSYLVTEVPMADEDGNSSTAEPTKISRLKDFIHRAIDKMVQVASNISTFMQEYFEPSKTDNNEKDESFKSNEKEPSKTDNNEKDESFKSNEKDESFKSNEKDESFKSTFGPSLMALGIAVIMVIVFKRV